MEGEPGTSKRQASFVFDEDNPEEAKVEKLTALLSFSNANEGKKNINKCKNLRKKLHFIAFTAVTDLVIKKHSLLGNQTQVACTIGIHATN
jgi:hypothetical protein